VNNVAIGSLVGHLGNKVGPGAKCPTPPSHWQPGCQGIYPSE